MIQANAITFRYAPQSTPVFEQFSLDILPGITLLKGYSGCGKSSLLRLLAGYLKPECGTISIPPDNESPEAIFKRQRLGYLFQKLNLIPNLSIDNNMRMAAEIASLDPTRIEANLRYWTKQLQIEQLLAKKPSQLSVGQQQRAAIARVFIKDPDVILLDEPTSGLDDENTACIVQALQAYMKPSTYCLIATHDSRLGPLADQTHVFPPPAL